MTLQPVTRRFAQAVIDGGAITGTFEEGARHDRLPGAMGAAIRDIDSGAAAVLPTVWLVVRRADGRIIGDLGTHGPHGFPAPARTLGIPPQVRFRAQTMCATS